MTEIKTLNKISPVGLECFDKQKYICGDEFENPEAILVRSASMHDMEVGDKLLAVARAGAGVNNIPVSEMAEKGIVVFNTPGANANAVKELVLLGTKIHLTIRRDRREVLWEVRVSFSGPRPLDLFCKKIYNHELLFCVCILKAPTSAYGSSP